MRFSQAMANFENGALIARHRWNRDVQEGDRESISFVFLERAYQTSTPQTMLESNHFEDREMTMLNHPMRKNRGNKVSVWVPTVEDMCSRDWYVVNFNNPDWDTIRGQFPRRRDVEQDAEQTEE